MRISSSPTPVGELFQIHGSENKHRLHLNSSLRTKRCPTHTMQKLFQWFLYVSHRFVKDAPLRLSNLAKYVDEFVLYDFYYEYTLKEMDILYKLLDSKHIDGTLREWLCNKLKFGWQDKCSNCNIHHKHTRTFEKIPFLFAGVYKALRDVHDHPLRSYLYKVSYNQHPQQLLVDARLFL